ncbi:MAG: ABC transporter permease subunit [Clostridiales Family XIII bacterium]|jgi:NitT/TauT family transport system permease protein|nr:ABC transporter permease subunit [Clostridiales Family XIII bacterium]
MLVTPVWIAGFLLVWEIGAFVVADIKRTPENVLPHIYQIVQSIFSATPVSNKMTAAEIVAVNAGATLLRAGFGFVLGAAFGFALAVLMRLSKLIERIAFPYLTIIQMIPILGIAPIMLAVTGSIDKSRVAIAAILTFYPVAVNTLAGFKAIEKERLELMYSYAAGKRAIYTKTLIPFCTPYLFTGLKIAAPMAITASILVDTLQGDGGLGCMLSQSLKHAMSIYVFWQIVFFSAIVGILSFFLMGAAEKLFMPQKRKRRRAAACARGEAAG